MRGIEQVPLLYDAMMAVAEATGFRSWRKQLVAGARGRVLAPAGRLRMLEHVRSRRPWFARWQDLIQPAWTLVSGGCHPNRDTESAGFMPRPPVALRSFADAETRRSWIATKNLQVFSLWHADLPGFEVDLFVEEPFDFDEVWGRRIEVALESTHAPVLGLGDLLELKRQAGRAQDLEDVAALEALSRGDDDV